MYHFQKNIRIQRRTELQLLQSMVKLLLHMQLLMDKVDRRLRGTLLNSLLLELCILFNQISDIPGLHQRNSLKAGSNVKSFASDNLIIFAVNRQQMHFVCCLTALNLNFCNGYSLHTKVIRQEFWVQITSEQNIWHFNHFCR